MVEYGCDPQAGAQPGDQVADTDGLARERAEATAAYWAAETLAELCAAYARMRAAACPPSSGETDPGYVPAELRPPPEHAEHGSLHWISASGINVVWRWWCKSSFGEDRWVNDIGHELSPRAAASAAFRYLGPAEWKSIGGVTVEVRALIAERDEAWDRIAALEAECRALRADARTWEVRANELEAELAALKPLIPQPAKPPRSFPARALRFGVVAP